jgi:hypothetical protein
MALKKNLSLVVFNSFFFYEGATELYGGVKLEQFCEWELCGFLQYLTLNK